MRSKGTTEHPSAQIASFVASQLTRALWRQIRASRRTQGALEIGIFGVALAVAASARPARIVHHSLAALAARFARGGTPLPWPPAQPAQSAASVPEPDIAEQLAAPAELVTQQNYRRRSARVPGPAGGLLRGARGFAEEHAISWSSMDRSLRLITGVAVGQLLVAGFLIALHSLMGPQLSLYPIDGEMLVMPVVVFGCSLLFLILAWSFILSGALHAHWSIGAPVVFAFALTAFAPLLKQRMCEACDGRSAYGDSLAATGTVLAVAVWGVLQWRAHPRDARSDGRGEGSVGGSPLSTLVGVFGLMCAYYAALWLSSWQAHATDQFPAAVMTGLAPIAIVLIPALMAAGSDWAEMGQEMAGAAARLVAGAPRSWLLPILSALVASVGLAYVVSAEGPIGFGPRAAAGVVLLIGLVVWIAVWARVGRWRPAHVPPVALLAIVYGGTVAVVVLLVLTAILAASVYPAIQPLATFSEGPYEIYRHDGDSASFSISRPTAWQVGSEHFGRFVRSTISSPDDPPRASLVVLSIDGGSNDLRPGTDPREVLQRFVSVEPFCSAASCSFVDGGVDGPWQMVQGTTPVAGFVGRIQLLPDHSWSLMEMCLSASCAETTPALERMVASWRPDLDAAAPTPSLQPVNDVCDGCLTSRSALGDALFSASLNILYAALAVIGLRLIVRHRHGAGPLAAVGLFCFIAGAEGLCQHLGGWNQAVRFLPLEATLAVLTLAATAWALLPHGSRIKAAKLLAVLFLAVVNLQWLLVLFVIYSVAISGSQQFLIVQAVVLLLALGWDLVMSGKHMTNVEGRRLSRRARMLLYFGYVMLVSTMVLAQTAQTFEATHLPREAFLEPELLVQEGIVDLGQPLIVVGLVLAIASWWTTNVRRPRALSAQ